MTTDIDKLAQQMREAAEKATPGPWYRNIKPARKYTTVWAGRNTHIAHVSVGGFDGTKFSEDELEANLDHIALANPAAVLALLDDRDRLREALKNAAGFIDTPVMRRRHGGEQFYSAVVDSVRAARAALKEQTP